MGNSIEEKTSLKRSQGTYELPEITDDLSCPVCGKKTLKMSRTLYKLPDGDDIFILLLECNECNYRKTDMISMFTAFQPGEYRLCVDDGDLTHKIFRGATGNLDIEEIGVSIERGPAANFDFTNIEGILLKIEEKLKFFLETNPIDSIEWKNCNESIKRLRKCMAGEMVFNVVLKDTDGGSYITPTSADKMTFVSYKKKKDQPDKKNS
ncbi:hypothetical protein NEF87_002418 [Candidatus Lokiarchaeum ossiferum]|uniref:Zinc finger ZPR1-type domain-containing protein n=1 Tax=Candidatus Lokiarchaeum ossiferum TaxID=2951803 RepID=A0ABY6HRJ7_9ARCH|nr:hypothetical protein NEF87_002418 [Candidatus Lokiarchaeum sp. B-35]